MTEFYTTLADFWGEAYDDQAAEALLKALQDWAYEDREMVKCMDLHARCVKLARHYRGEDVIATNVAGALRVQEEKVAQAHARLEEVALLLNIEQLDVLKKIVRGD